MSTSGCADRHTAALERFSCLLCPLTVLSQRLRVAFLAGTVVEVL